MLSSAILLLQERCSSKSDSPGSSPDNLSPEARVTLNDLDALVISFPQGYLDSPRVANGVSLFLIQMIYQAASTHIRLGGGQPDATRRTQIDIHKDMLDRLSWRWRVAGKEP